MQGCVTKKCKVWNILCTYMLVCTWANLTKLRNIAPCIFFLWKQIFLVSLSTPVCAKWKKKPSSCLLFNGVAHLDNKEVNLVKGQLLNAHFWYFAAPPEPAEQRQCRFHPPCPTAIQRETVGSRHKAPFQESIASVYSLCFLFSPNHWTFTELLHLRVTQRQHTKSACVLQCTNTDLVGELHCSPAMGTWGLFSYEFYSCGALLRPLSPLKLHLESDTCQLAAQMCSEVNQGAN